MKKVLAGMVVLIFATLACGAGAATQPVDNVSTIVASTMQALTAAAPTQPGGIHISFQNVSFVIPTGLASGAAGQQVAAVDETSGAPWEVAPASLHLTFQGYPLQDKYFQPNITVFPAQEYASVNQGAQISLQRLQSLLTNPATPLEGENLPQVPGFNAQMIAFQTKAVKFMNGSGVRVVAQYSQAVMAINNQDIFYQFIGLTSDGKYLIIAILPVNAPFLAATDDPSAPIPPGGIPFPDMSTGQGAEFDAYYKAIIDKMNATSPDQFQPSLTLLDLLIQSLQVAP